MWWAREERGQGSGGAEGQGSRGAEGRRGSGQIAGLDEFVKDGGFFRGDDAQFLLQDTDALLVLAQGGGALVGPGVQLHQLAMSFFV